MKQLTKSFFKKPTLEIAKNLLGKYLIHETPDGKISGKIVETEAYLKNDPASHSFNGQTKRNSSMFDTAGKSYVYFTYGMHHCFNIVTADKGTGEAVLIRALKPFEGINLMKKNRKTENEKNLTNGPAKLTQALGITKSHDRINLLNKNSRLKLMQDKKQNFKIIQTKRIGITKGVNLPHRFYIKDNKWISKK